MNRFRLRSRRLRLLGEHRLRIAMLCAAAAATLLTLFTSLPAHAEPTPAPSAAAPSNSTGSGTQTGHVPNEEEIRAAQQFLDEQQQHRSAEEQQEALQEKTDKLRKALPHEGGVLSVFNVTDSGGLPISAYTVSSDTGGLTDVDLGVENMLTEMCFMATKWLIAFCCWLIAWALSFGLAKLLLAPVLAVANSLHARVIMEMGLPGLFLSVCALLCVARIFFGNRAHGFADAGLSLLLAALTATLLASPPQVLMGPDGALGVARGFSLEVADVILDANPAAPQQPQVTTEVEASSLARPVTDAVTDAFIVKPAMLLQYGQTFDGKCARAYSKSKIAQLAYDRQVDAGISKAKQFSDAAGTIAPFPDPSHIADMAGEWAKNHFGHPPMEKFEDQCVHGDVEAAKKASMDKVGGAVFLLIAACIIAVLVIALAGSFLVAQVRIAWDAIRGEVALVVGTVPGAGRGFLWDWLASVCRSLGQMLVSVIALAVFVVVVQAVLTSTMTDSGHELTLRFILLDVLCIAAVKKRSQLATRSQQIAGNLRSKMSAAGIGGTHGSIFTPPGVPNTRSPHHGRTAARGVIRGALVGAAVSKHNYLAAMGYAMPTSVGATALMSRLNTMNRSHRRGPGRPSPARPAGRPSRPAPGPAPDRSTPQPNTSHTRQPSVPPPRPTHRPGSHRTTSPRSRAQARTASQPSASTRQQQLRQRLERRTQRTPPARRRP